MNVMQAMTSVTRQASVGADRGVADGQLRWHIDHLLAGSDELLGEQRAGPSGALNQVWLSPTQIRTDGVTQQPPRPPRPAIGVKPADFSQEVAGQRFALDVDRGGRLGASQERNPGSSTGRAC